MPKAYPPEFRLDVVEPPRVSWRQSVRESASTAIWSFALLSHLLG